MNNVSPYYFTVFTKPWNLSITELGAKVAAWGFDGIELPVRDGYAVHPGNAAAELPRAVRLLQAEFGLSVDSIAGTADAATIAACGEARVPLIRICPSLSSGERYQDGAARYQRAWEALVPDLEKHKVAIGVQNHSGRCVPVHAFGLRDLLAPFDPRHVCAVWDAAHNALEGEQPEMALDLICGSHLRMVNLKNGYKQSETNGEGETLWRTHWTSGKAGVASWGRVAADLARRNWVGPICLTAEYSEKEKVDEYIVSDLAYARSLFPGAA